MTIYPISGFSDPFSSMTHLFTAPVFLIIGIIMLKKFGSTKIRAISLSVFVFGVVLLLSISGVFHLLSPGSSGRYVLKILDHAAIFVLIAATFTPIHILQFKGVQRWGILLLIWVIAVTGITLKSIFFEDIAESLSLAIYLGLGWLGVSTGYLLFKKIGLKKIMPLLYGAVAYTLGAIFEFIRYPTLIFGVIGPHEIFHVFVLIGISFHWQFIWRISELHKSGQEGFQNHPDL